MNDFFAAGNVGSLIRRNIVGEYTLLGDRWEMSKKKSVDYLD
jgi:hypothetical protein